MTSFISSCNFKGEFVDTEIKQEMILKVDETLQPEFEKCKRNIDGINWSGSCEKICNLYDIFNYSPQ